MRFAFVSLFAAAALLPPASSFGAELNHEQAFIDPTVISVPNPGGTVTIDAVTSPVEVPGLGLVRGASFYRVYLGNLPGKGEHSLLPPILQLQRGSDVTLRLRNSLITVDPKDLAPPKADSAAAAIGQGSAGPHRFPDPSNIHVHGLVVAPTGVGFPPTRTAGGRLGDCVFPLATSQAKVGADPHTGHGGGADKFLKQDPCSSDKMPDMASLMQKDELSYSYRIPQDHPSGLFWFHPHPHGQSEIQLSNGVSGLLTVGSIWDYLYVQCRLTSSPYDASGACMTQDEQREEADLERRAVGRPGADGVIRVRYFGLKDIQVRKTKDYSKTLPQFDLIPFPRRPVSASPNIPVGQSEKAAFDSATGARKTLCGTLELPGGLDDDLSLPNLKRPDGTPARAPGVCWSGDDGKGRDGWAFTVSGQVYPKVSIAPNGSELWRIANMSADVTYRLQLKDDGYGENDAGEVLSVLPVAIDGVPVATSNSPELAAGPQAQGKGSSTSGRGVSEITLMPSARIEVLVRRCGAKESPQADGCIPAGKKVRATLRTRGLTTGLKPEPGDDPPGDQWPAVDLARVEWEAPPSTAPTAPVMRLRVAGIARPAAPFEAVSGEISAVISGGTGAGSAAEKIGLPPSAAATPATDACDLTKYAGKHGPGERGGFSINGPRVRLIRLNNNKLPVSVGSSGTDEVFGIHDETFDLVSELKAPRTKIRIATLAEEGTKNPGVDSWIGDIDLTDPCQQEATNAKGQYPKRPAATVKTFTDYYRPFDMGYDNITVNHGSEEYWLVINDSQECHNFHIHQMKFSVIDSDFIGKTPDTSRQDQCAGDRKAERPINQRALHDNFPLPPSARVLFRIVFDGPKLGRFVFHCHILEHEDKGMMAILKVIKPRVAATQ